MTSIRYRAKPLWRESSMHEKGRPILIAETPCNLLIRLKGLRQVMALPYGLLYTWASQVEAERVRKQKKAEREARRKGKREK